MSVTYRIDHLNESSADIVIDEWLHYLLICTGYQMWIWWLLSECHDTPSKLRCTTLDVQIFEPASPTEWLFQRSEANMVEVSCWYSQCKVYIMVFCLEVPELYTLYYYFNQSKWEIHKTAYFILVIHQIFLESWNCLNLEFRCLKLNALGRFPQSIMQFRRSGLIYISGHRLWTMDYK